MSDFIFETERLHFRNWKTEDIPLFVAMNKDKDVMEYFPHTLTEKRSREIITEIQQSIAHRGYGFWAVERKEDAHFIGFIGLSHATFDADFTPCDDIGWRLAKAYWGKGYATEGARGCLAYAFKQLGMRTVSSFTSVHNKKSEHIMKKLKMKRIKEFDHPNIEKNHRICRHVLYELERSDYIKSSP